MVPLESDANADKRSIGSKVDSIRDGDNDVIEDDDVTPTDHEEVLEVPRTVGLIGGISFIVGTIIGKTALHQTYHFFPDSFQQSWNGLRYRSEEEALLR